MASKKKRQEFELLCTKQASRPSAPDDAQLIRRLKAGEREAFNDLSRRYHQQAHAEAYRILGNDDDASDAVQEAFLNLYTYIDQFQGQSSVWPWLRTITLNAARNIIRRESARRSRERKTASVLPTEETFTPLDTLLAKEFPEWLEQHAEPLISLICKLLVEKELTHMEMADRIGTTVWHVRQAIIKLGEKLLEYRADESA